MRPAAALTVLSCLLVVAGCGGSDGDPTATATEPGGGSTLEELWRAPGDDVAVTPGTETHEPGNVRISFLVADAKGLPVTLPTARVWVARALDARPFLETEAKLERIGVPGGAGWTTHELHLDPGDLVVTFSDGVLDLYDGTLGAVDRVAELARASASADELVERITGLAARQANPDDVTVLVVRREA